ncbi:hypothetical protein [Paraburkholderia sediminicola]|uniref:hypothetical protein n=1 Tax=Paraburkholderia sediminicola TaxID=458836 RepID=UPI0038B9237B
MQLTVCRNSVRYNVKSSFPDCPARQSGLLIAEGRSPMRPREGLVCLQKPGPVPCVSSFSTSNTQTMVTRYVDLLPIGLENRVRCVPAEQFCAQPAVQDLFFRGQEQHYGLHQRCTIIRIPVQFYIKRSDQNRMVRLG